MDGLPAYGIVLWLFTVTGIHTCTQFNFYHTEIGPLNHATVNSLAVY